MRVLHIDAGKALRGGQWQTLHLMGGLAKRGVLIRLLAVRGTPLFRKAQTQGLKVLPLNLFSVWRESGWADLVHCHDSRAHTMAWLASIGPGQRAPVVVSRRVAFSREEHGFHGQKVRFRRAVFEYFPGGQRATHGGGRSGGSHCTGP